MSLYRMIARLAAVHAFNNYLQEPWPTLAGPNIFDSKIEPIEDMKHDRAFPCVVVYTDYDKDHWNKGSMPHKDRAMSVTLELMIVQAAREEQDDQAPAVYKLDCPFTDSEIEMSLDILETQLSRALRAGTEASDAYNYICTTPIAVISRRGATIEGGQRLAARQITLEMKAVRDNIAGAIPPQIGDFLDKLEQHSDYADRVESIRAAMTAPASETAFQRMMRAFGYTRDLTARLGGAPDVQVILPPNLTFTLNGPPP